MAIVFRRDALSGPDELRRELSAYNVAPSKKDFLAKRVFPCFLKATNLLPEVAARLATTMERAGGEAVVAKSILEGSSFRDLLLFGTEHTFRQFCMFSSRPGFLPIDLTIELNNLLDSRIHSPDFLEGRTCRLRLNRPLIMGILNVTPDSFYSESRSLAIDNALCRGRQMVSEGVNIIDVGGESTRPGAPAVSLQEELDRVAPVVELLRKEIGCPLSVDTCKSGVARESIAAGADFINDISGLHFDEDMPEVVSRGGAGLFLMHTRGRPEVMQQDTSYEDLIGEIIEYLQESLRRAAKAGIPKERLAVDPGIGFGKNSIGNLEILNRLSEIHHLGRPILLGTSRKAFIGQVLGQKEPAKRLAGTLATIAMGVAAGVHIFRVHDVQAAREAALMAWAVCNQKMP